MNPKTIQNDIIGNFKALKKNKMLTTKPPPLYDCIKQYFHYLNVGYENEIYPYNGGLFLPDEVLDSLVISDEILQPHLEKIASYNFETDVDVNILGHIFENSLAEIDEIKNEIRGKKVSSKRKSEGVYYTPTAITNYIIRNTLGEMCENKKAEIELNTDDYFYDVSRKKKEKDFLINKLTVYREFLKQLTVCDPACGSGAFLNAAFQYLIQEHRLIDNLTSLLLTGKDAFVFSDIENFILENNLYGVDINEEGVEIAKLSLWLRSIKKNHKLSTLNNNIRCGNSLIGKDLFDPIKEVFKKAFIWQEEFPHIFEKGGFDIVLGNPPYGAKYPEEHKKYFQENYKSAKTISGKQKGSLDTFVLFLERAHSLVRQDGFVGMIVPMSVVSSDSVTALHNILFESCSEITVSSYAVRPQPVFESAVVNTSILVFQKDNKENQKILATKMYRKDESFNLEKLINNIEFVEVQDLLLEGRFPKISTEIERSILKKIFSWDDSIGKLKVTVEQQLRDLSITKGNISVNNGGMSINVGNVELIKGNISIENGDIAVRGKKITIKTKDVSVNNSKINSIVGEFDDTNKPIYYRFAGGRYFKLITNYTTNSSAEVIIYFDKKIVNSIGAILSSNLFFWFYQIFSDNLNLKQLEIESFTVPLEKLTSTVIAKLEKLYSEYLADIEKNANVRKVTGSKTYKVDTFKEYKIVYSKHLIDQIDDIICPLYGLTVEETEFIKNYEIEFRMRGEKV